MVTSAFPGEGKTFVASNLAASIAMGTDEQVLLIDCDLKKPSIHEVFGRNRTEGVYEYLDRKKELDELILETKVQGLSMLSAGKVSARPSESGSSPAMERFMKEIKQRFRDWVVIIDTAPISVSAGTRVIAKYVDAIVFVVMAQKWPRKEIQRSMESLGKEKILGVIFNGYEHGMHGYRKYYSKYYGKQVDGCWTMVEKLFAVQHRLNPLHIYCRLLDRGINRRISVWICRTYEILFFTGFNFSLKVLIHSCLLLDKSYAMRDWFRK